MTDRPVVVWVDGDPAAQGSKRLVRTKGGRTLMLENSRKVKPWRAAIADAARSCNCPILMGDVAIYAVVRFVRPQSHYRKDGTIRVGLESRPGYADCDKLARAICDGLAGIAYHNDRQVAILAIERVWAAAGTGPGAVIGIGPAPAVGRFEYVHA